MDYQTIEKRVKKIVSQVTGFDESILTDDIELLDELGIDSIQDISIFLQLENAFDIDLKVDESVIVSNITLKELTNIIAEKINNKK